MNIPLVLISFVLAVALACYVYHPSRRNEPPTTIEFVVLTIGFVGLTAAMSGVFRP